MVGVVKVCIYCKAALTPTTRKAHVWPASMGGRLQAREICCNDCNNALGAIEDTLRRSLVHAFAAVGATNDEKEPFAVRIQFVDREFLMAEGNAEMETPGSRFDQETKSMVVPLPAGLDVQAEALAKAMWSHGLGPDDIEKLNLTPGDPEPELPVGPTRSDHDLSVGGPIEHTRVFVKMAVELLASHSHDLAMRGELSEARRFARYGGGSFRGKPDTRSEGSGLVTSRTPEVFNAIEVWTFGASMFFRATFLGPIVFTGTLTTTWSGERFRAAYAFDARNPASVVSNNFVAGDGPNLALWFDGMKDEASSSAADKLEAISLKLAQSKPRVEREAPPDLSVLRDAVKNRLAEMPPKKNKKKPKA